MFDIEKLKFDEKGLIPAIVVDDETGDVLTLAYMNKESLAISGAVQDRNSGSKVKQAVIISILSALLLTVIWMHLLFA